QHGAVHGRRGRAPGPPPAARLTTAVAVAVDRRTLIGLRILAQGLLPAHRISQAAGADAVTDVAAAFGAHQGQDLPGVVASLALRTPGGTDAVTDAFTAGTVVRGYPMRGTVFAVAAADLRWMTQLCAQPAIRAAIARRPAMGLDESDVRRAREIVMQVTEGRSLPVSGEEFGSGVPRAGLLAARDAAGLATAGGRGDGLLVHLISTGAAAYGP